VGRVVKNLLAGADGKLKECKSAFSAVRSLHYQLTLPWVADPHAQRQTGARLLPNLLFEKYLTAMSAQKRHAQAALDAFIADYPDAVLRAKANLGTLADADYPDAEQVRAAFRVAFDFEPIPSNTSFRGLPDHMLEKLSDGLRRKQDRMIQTAQTSMWEEVRARVQNIAARLDDPKTTFRNTTVEHVRDLITLLPGWNIVADPRAAEIVGDIKAMLDGLEVKDLRNDPLLRKAAAAQGQGIIAKLNGYGL
jgi:hypothetical protein